MSSTADGSAKGIADCAADGAATGTARLDWVDTGRGIAIVLVVLYHSVSWIKGLDPQVAPWVEINAALSTLRMPLFFALSGMFAVKWLTADWSALLHAKVRLFAWVLAVWTVIGSSTLVLGQIMNDVPVNLWGSLRAVLLSPVLPRFELWFIWALALFFVVAKATRRVNVIAQLVVAGAFSVVALGLWITSNTGWTGSVKYYFFFLCGLHLRSLLIRVAAVRSRPVLVGTVVAWAGLSVGLGVGGLRGVVPLYFLNCVLGVLAGIALSRALSGIPLLGRLGRQTLPIYLAHTPIVILLLFAVHSAPIWPLPPVLAAVSPLLLAALATTAALALHRALAPTPLRLLYEPPPSRPRRTTGQR